MSIQPSRLVSILTLNPLTSALHYFLPFTKSFSNNFQEITRNSSETAMMPQATIDLLFQEVGNLKRHAGVEREITIYTALNHQFESFGGNFSFSCPSISIPYQHLRCFGQALPDENLRENRWVYSDDETRFLIACELGAIGANSALLRIAIKVTGVTSMFLIYACAVGAIFGSVLFIGSLALYAYSEVRVESRADIEGAEILGRLLNNRPRAFQIAIEALEKQRKFNLYYRENSDYSAITKKGNDLSDFNHFWLTDRIDACRAEYRKAGEIPALISSLGMP